MRYYYLNVGSSRDLKGFDRVLYRALEIFPGVLAWSTLLGLVALSAIKPVWVAIFIIIFDIYFLLRVTYSTTHLLINWRRFKKNLLVNWHEKLRLDFPGEWERLWQLVIIPAYDEPEDIIRANVEALMASTWDMRKFIVVIGLEQRREDAHSLGRRLQQEYENKFGYFLVTYHPAGTPGEIPGKGSNETFAACSATREIIDKNHILYDDILVSSFDVDTRVFSGYFDCLAHVFLSTPDRYHRSYQPIPVYHNNIWHAPAFSRVIASGATFWQMVDQEQPERLSTFSSHSMSLTALAEVGFWSTNIVSEDHRIYVKALLHYDGNYSVVPLHYPISMDANVAPTWWQTARNIYRQQRRWSWGVENLSYMLFGFLKNKKIPLGKKLFLTFTLVEAFWAWSTYALIIFVFGWLPTLLGGTAFKTTVVSHNLPVITSTIMTAAMIGVIASVVIAISLLPPAPFSMRWYKKTPLIIQWLLVPFIVIIFGSLPALESQTRLMLGGKFRLGFWTTPKYRNP